LKIGKIRATSSFSMTLKQLVSYRISKLQRKSSSGMETKFLKTKAYYGFILTYKAKIKIASTTVTFTKTLQRNICKIYF